MLARNVGYLFPYNVALRQFVTSPGSNMPASITPRLKRRDAASLSLRLETGTSGSDTAALQLASGYVLTFALKKTDDYQGSAVVLATDWTWDADAGAYVGAPNTNTYRMSQLFCGATGLNVRAGDYTLAASDSGKLVVPSVAAAITIPANASVAIANGTIIYLLRGSSGAVTISAGAVTVTYLNDLDSGVLGGLSENTVYKLTKTGTDTWSLGLATDAASISLMGEWSWLEPGAAAPTSTQTLAFTIDNDVIRGDEGSPLNSDNPLAYYTAAQCNALFFTLASAGALAELDTVGTTELEDVSVTSAKIALLAITTALLAAGAVTTDKLADLAVTAAKIADGTITATQIANLTITAGKLANGTITATQIADATITGAKIASATITRDKLALARAVLTADKVLNNSTADRDAEILTLPANTVAAGEVFDLMFAGIHSVSAAVLNLSIKVNGTKSALAVFASSTATAAPFHVNGTITILSTTQALVTLWAAKTGGTVIEIAPQVMTIDTTSAITITACAQAGSATSQSTTWKAGYITQRP